jgi:hypothetical protein
MYLGLGIRVWGLGFWLLEIVKVKGHRKCEFRAWILEVSGVKIWQRQTRGRGLRVWGLGIRV